MRKIYQNEICLRFLNDLKCWVFSYSLCGINTKYGFLGSQGDKRARELSGFNGENNREFEYFGEYQDKHKLIKIKYVIWGRKEGKYRQYKAEILEDLNEEPKQAGIEPVEPKQEEAKPKQETRDCVCERCGKVGFVAKFGDGFYCRECIDYISKYGNNF